MALSRHDTGSSRPLPVDEIVRQAQDYEWVTFRPLKSWIRSAQLLLTTATNLEQDDDLQRAYLYLYRHADLVIGKFPTHPQYKDPVLRDEVRRHQKLVTENVQKLEKWKPKIKRDYERYAKAVERRNAERQRVEAERLSDQRERVANEEFGRRPVPSDDGAYDDGRSQTLDVNEHRQLAVDLAHRELQRRDDTRTRQAGIPPGTVSERRRGIVVDDNLYPAPRNDEGRGLGVVGEGVRQAGRASQHPGQRQQPLPPSRPPQSRQTSSSYHYPSVPRKEGPIQWDTPAMVPSRRTPDSPSPPSRPAKEPNNYSPLPPVPAKLTSPPPSPQNAPAKPTFRSTATTESGTPLRPVLLPPTLRTTFLNLAHANTSANLETCGILCGQLISNALFITHLIIPDQHSTSDTCDTTEEGDNALFDYCDANSLLVCGWIHTHPSQSCFLSSRDLHTSSGYQVMLPEAIAIVCAPRHNPDWGVFRLTDPPGLRHLLKCERKGLFHPHEEARLYTDAGSPGHVVEGEGLRFEVVDLRKRS